MLFGGPHIWWPDSSPLSCPFFPFGGLCFSRDGGLPDGASLWLQMPFSPSALDGLRGRTAPLQVAQVPQEETLEVCAVCKPPGIAPAVLLWKFLAPPAEWQVHLPLGSAEATSAGGLGGLSIPPLSAIWLLHAGTFHALLPSDEGCLLPIRPGPQGRAPHPSLAPFLQLASAHQQPAT